MKIKILASASVDLIDGYRFYEMQADAVLDCRRNPAWIRKRLS